MDSLVIAIFAAVILTAIALTMFGERHGWGVTPLGLLGLGFLIPFALLLVGAL